MDWKIGNKREFYIGSKGHGYCDKHYQRFRKYGNPYTVKWNTKHTKYDADVIFYE